MSDRLREAVELLEAHGTVAEASRVSGIPRTTIRDRLEKAARGGVVPKKSVAPSKVVESELKAEIELLKAEQKRDKSTIEKLEQSIDRLRKVDKKGLFKPLKEKGSKGDYIRVVIPDTHGMFVDQDAVNAMLGDIESLTAKEVVLLGDHLDCGGFLAQHHVLNYQAELQYSYEQDCEAANQFLDQVQKASPDSDNHFLFGNHECLTPDHEVLTDSGWVPIPEVTKSHMVASMNDIGEVEWDHSLATHSYDFDGELVVVDSGMWKARMTPEHRVWYWSQNKTDLVCKRAKQLVSPEGKGRSNAYDIPVAAISGREDFAISDNHLRLFAWILTDGSLCDGKVKIYQSKPDMLPEIRDLLNLCGAETSESSRTRGEHLEAYDFSVFGEVKGLMLELFGVDGRCETSDKKIPEWVELLSDRQFDIFMDVVIKADGSRPSSHKENKTSAACVYGTEEFLDRLQAVTCTHGWSASKRWRSHKPDADNFSTEDGYWCLNVCKRNRRKVENKYIKNEKYSGKVYCLTTKWDNFVIRHKGNVSVTGNSRIEKWCVNATLKNPSDASMLHKLLSAESVLHLDARGMNYYKLSEFHMNLRVRGTIKLGKCYFTHGTNHSRHSSAKHAQQFSGCVVHGHIHREQSDMIAPVAVGAIGAWCPGCLCKLQPMYRHTCPSNWTHGYAIQFVRADGEFLHLNIPIVDGRSFLGPLLDIVS
jgi:hypothetical protein